MYCTKLLGAILYSRKFSPGENFRQFCYLVLLARFCSMNFLSCVNNYIEHMATFTVLAIIYSIEYFCIQKYLGLAKSFSSETFRLYGITIKH